MIDVECLDRRRAASEYAQIEPNGNGVGDGRDGRVTGIHEGDDDGRVVLEDAVGPDTADSVFAAGRETVPHIRQLDEGDVARVRAEDHALGAQLITQPVLWRDGRPTV